MGLPHHPSRSTNHESKMTITRHPLTIPILLLTTLILTSCGGIFYAPPTAAEYCGIDPVLLNYEAEEKAEAEGKTVIELWAAGQRYVCRRAYAPLLAAHQRPDLSLAVRVRNLEINNNPFTDQLLDLAARGEAPDIAYVSGSNAVRLGEAGHLYPLEACRQRVEFRQIPERFWTSFSVDKRAWGVPVESELRLLFFNKELLRNLGWTEAQIEALPTQIRDGAYTMQDLVATARAAVEANVVESGLAFILSRSQRATITPLYMQSGGKILASGPDDLRMDRAALEQTYAALAMLNNHSLFDQRMAISSFNDWGNKLLMKDAAAHSRFLFWHATIVEMQHMATDYAGTDGDADLLGDSIGVALLPAMTDIGTGYAHISHTGAYVIFAEEATGRRNQSAACDLLAATLASDIMKEHAEKTGYITFSSDGLYLPSWFPTDLPTERIQFNPPVVLGIDDYRRILTESAVHVERGELTAGEAVNVAVERLRNEFGDRLTVE